jgi:hypothetical protein
MIRDHKTLYIRHSDILKIKDAGIDLVEHVTIGQKCITDANSDHRLA